MENKIVIPAGTFKENSTLKIKVETMRNIKLSLETATRWYNGQDQELKDLAVQTYPELAKKEPLKMRRSWG